MEVQVTLDTSQANELLESMREKLTPPEFNKLMKRTVWETGKGLKKPIREEVQKKYAVDNKFVNEGIQKPELQFGWSSICCVIPLKGKKGTVGGTFTADGGFYGGPPPKYKITANILKGRASTLPDHLPHQGGNPPFRNANVKGFVTQKGKKVLRKEDGREEAIKKSRKKKVATEIGLTVMTRTGSGRMPIKGVSALALPQMPMNQARPAIERTANEILMERAVHNFGFLFGRVK